MPITAETERILLNKYKLTSLYPTEWPQGDDDSDDEYELNASAKNRDSSRFQHIARNASIKSSAKSARSAAADVGVQKDEPDALGMAPSVAAELRRRGLPVEEDIALRNKFMLSSTTFSPATYLSYVHRDTDTNDLFRGLDFLSKSIEQKSASLKVLVESNFERFVRAKATIDTVYTEMRTQGVDTPSRASQTPQTAAGMRPHSRQTSKNNSHFRNTSGPWGSQAKLPNVDKKKNALTKESDYGVQGIKTPLQDVAIKAEEVWGPALGGREKEETLKALQTTLDQYHEVFTLSGTVSESIKKNDYDGVVDAYKKAKSHAEKANKIGAIAQEHNMQLGESDVQQIVVTAKMWHDISLQVDVFKQEVWKRLRNSHGKRPAAVAEESDKELHMELLTTLLLLGVDENPIWVWINSHYLYLKDRIARAFERGRIELEIQRRRLAATTKTDNAALARHLRSPSAATSILKLTKDAARDMDTAPILAFWERVHTCISALLSTKNGVLAEIVQWYKNAQDFVDNNAQKSFPSAVFANGFEHLALEPEHNEGIRAAAIDLANILRENVDDFFQKEPVTDLSDLYSPIPPTPVTPDALSPSTPSIKRAFTFDPNNVPPPSPRRGDSWEKFAFWPPGSNSLSGAHYLAQLVTLVGNAMGTLAGLDAVKQSVDTTKFKETVSGTRERLITAICSSWLADSENCKALESWVRSPDRRDLTLMPTYFEAWVSRVLSDVQRIAYVSDAVAVKNSNGVQIIVPPPAKHLQVVRNCFTTSLYKSLQGFVENANGVDEASGGVSREADPDGITRAKHRTVDVDGTGALGSEAVDASNKNVRRLLTLSNLNHLRSEVIPQLISQFEASFSVKLTEESKTIRDILAQIDAGLFEAYVQPIVSKITEIISEGISAKDWEPVTDRPTNAQPYVYDVLLLLVEVHAEVNNGATTTLTGQILSYLLEQCSNALIKAFTQRPRYSLAALMQATLDVEFMAQTLNNYTTDRAGEIQSQIYLALDERTDNDARAKLQGELPEMRSILKKLRESTKGEFGCFRRERRGRRDAGSSGAEKR